MASQAIRKLMHQQVFRNQGEDQSVTQEHSTNGEKTTMNQISWEGRRWAEGRDHSGIWKGEMTGRCYAVVMRQVVILVMVLMLPWWLWS